MGPGGDLYGAVADALAEIGRAFGAARDVELARSGRSSNGGGPDAECGFGFRRWNRAERQIAPPLVVEVDGGDAQVGGLAEFLDGRQKIVLLLRGSAPAAPLVRLATPGVFVMQTGEAADLERLAGEEGPGIAEVVCLTFGRCCGGRRCGLTGLPSVVMGVRLARSGIPPEEAWRTLRMRCEACRLTTEMQVLDNVTAYCPACGSANRWFRVDAGETAHLPEPGASSA